MIKWKIGNRVRKLGYHSRDLCLPVRCLKEIFDRKPWTTEKAALYKTLVSEEGPHKSFSCLKLRFKTQSKRETTSQGLDSGGLVIHFKLSGIKHKSPDPTYLPQWGIPPLLGNSRCIERAASVGWYSNAWGLWIWVRTLVWGLLKCPCSLLCDCLPIPVGTMKLKVGMVVLVVVSPQNQTFQEEVWNKL